MKDLKIWFYRVAELFSPIGLLLIGAKNNWNKQFTIAFLAGSVTSCYIHVLSLFFPLLFRYNDV